MAGLWDRKTTSPAPKKAAGSAMVLRPSARARKIIPDYVRTKTNIFCDCEGRGKKFHNFNVRCAACLHCGRRVKGIWLNEHEDECSLEKGER